MGKRVLGKTTPPSARGPHGAASEQPPAKAAKLGSTEQPSAKAAKPSAKVATPKAVASKATAGKKTAEAKPASKAAEAKSASEAELPAPAPADPHVEACRPIIQALRGGDYDEHSPATTDGSIVELLCDALPFAWKLPTIGARHEWQEQVLEAVASRLSDIVVAGRKDTVVATEQALGETDAEKIRNVANLESAVSRLAEMTQKRNDTKEAQRSTAAALEEAKAGLQAVQKKHEGAEKEREVIESEKSEHESAVEQLWAPLKASELDGKNKWRDRERLLKVLVGKMTRIGVDQSLLAALPVALKVKVDERGTFGQVVVTRAETAYSSHVDSLRRRLDNWVAEHAVCMAEIAEAEVAVKLAKEALQMAEEAKNVVEQDWSDAVIAEVETEKLVNSHDARCQALQQKLGEARAEHACVEEMCRHFSAMRSGTAPLSQVARAASGAPREKSAAAALVVEVEEDADEDEVEEVEESES